jgi:hypothetical protein
MPGGESGAMGGQQGRASGGNSGEMGGESPDTGNAGEAGAGPGQAETKGGVQGTAGKGAEQPPPSGAAPKVPDDIPADGTGEDQVARQLREAALAEKDPVVRDALWDQYRRHMGIRK